MRCLKIIVSFLLLGLLLTGCWDIKNIQDLNYYTAMGIDYVDGEYKIYVQMIDFVTVAKMDTGKPSQHTPVWVGTAKGKTVASAFNELYDTTQMKVLYGHISSIVYNERLLADKGLDEVFDLQSRYHELRYTPWVFGTKMDIEQLFVTTPFFNLSPLMSTLHQPRESYQQRSIIPPITLRELISDYREPGKTTLLPSLSVTNKEWKEDEKSHTVIHLDGAFMIRDEIYKGWIAEKNLMGLSRFDIRTDRNILLIEPEGEVIAALSTERPMHRIIPHVDGDEVTYTVQVRMTGNISEQVQPSTEKELRDYAAKAIEAELRALFLEGIKLDVDLLQLEYALYKQKIKAWKRLRARHQLKLTESSLKSIEVDVKLIHPGMLKMEKRKER